jgi:hypothetical protein
MCQAVGEIKKINRTKSPRIMVAHRYHKTPEKGGTYCTQSVPNSAVCLGFI